MISDLVTAQTKIARLETELASEVLAYAMLKVEELVFEYEFPE